MPRYGPTGTWAPIEIRQGCQAPVLRTSFVRKKANLDKITKEWLSYLAFLHFWHPSRPDPNNAPVILKVPMKVDHLKKFLWQTIILRGLHGPFLAKQLQFSMQVLSLSLYCKYR